MDLRITDKTIQEIFDRIFNLHPLLEKPYFEDALGRYVDELGQKLTSSDIVEQFEEYLNSERYEKIESIVEKYPDDVKDNLWATHKKHHKELITGFIERCSNDELKSVIEYICEEYQSRVLSTLMEQINPSVVDILGSLSDAKRKDQLREICDTYGLEGNI